MKQEPRTVCFDKTLGIEAAGQSGFTDQSYFTKYFKNFIGLTPKQYQNIFAGSDETYLSCKGGNHDDK